MASSSAPIGTSPPGWTPELFAGLCSHNGRGRMSNQNILACFNAQPGDLADVEKELAGFIHNKDEYYREAIAQNHSNQWKLARKDFAAYLQTVSKWSARLGDSNTAVPDACKQEAINTIIQRARDRVRDDHDREFQVYDHTPTRSRSYTRSPSHMSSGYSPARSGTSTMFSGVRRLTFNETCHEEPLECLRLASIHVISDNDDSTLMGRIPMRSICKPERWAVRTNNIFPEDADFGLLQAAIKQLILDDVEDRSRAHGSDVDMHGGEFVEFDYDLWYHLDRVRNQHELEASLNDYANGIRDGRNFVLTIVLNSYDVSSRAPLPADGALEPGCSNVGLPTSTEATTANAEGPPMIDNLLADEPVLLQPAPDQNDPRSHAEPLSSPSSLGDIFDCADNITHTGPSHYRSEQVTDEDEDVSKEIRVHLGESSSTRQNATREATSTLEDSMNIDNQYALPDYEETVLPDLLDDIVEDEVEEELEDEDYEEALINFTRQQFESEAGKIAQHSNFDDWERAADSFGIPVTKLLNQSKLKGSDRFIPVPPLFGANPNLGLMAHQFVGIDVMHSWVFGLIRGCIQADAMGLGKTIMNLTCFCWNLVLVMHAYTGKTVHPKQRLLVDTNRKFKNRDPRVGATFVSAYAAGGVEPWARDFVKVFQDGWLMTKCRDYKPQMIILHQDGEMLCKKYGGEVNGLYHKLTRKVIYEMFPVPDWEKARQSYADRDAIKFDVETLQWFGRDEDCWTPFDGATTSQPSPTSSRFIVVTTNQSWKTRFYTAFMKDMPIPPNVPLSKKLKEKGVKKDERVLLERQIRANYNKFLNGDGSSLNQVTRKARVQVGSRSHTITMIVDLLYCAWVIVDELHSYGGPTTMTYLNIIDPLRTGECADWPSFTGITGSILANGLSTILTFALKALVRKEDTEWCKLEYLAVKDLQAIDIKKALGSWKSFEANSRKGERKTLSQRINASETMKQNIQVIAHVMAMCLICRGYDSVDPGNMKLNVLDCKLKKEYVKVKYKPKYHEMLLEVESTIQAQIEQQYQEALEVWTEEGGDTSGRPKPKKGQPQQVDARNYQKAKVLASFPNILEAFREYQADNPDQPAIIGASTTWGDSLGSDNTVLKTIMAKPETILNSVLFHYVDSICKGSAKMDHVLATAERVGKTTSIGRHPAVLDETVHYKSKYCIATGVRLCRAIIFARMVKAFGRDKISLLSEGNNREDEITKWRSYHTDHHSSGDRVQYMIAGLKMVCQSIDMVECNWFEGFEPCPINAEAMQYAYRGFRPGQMAPLVTVIWLVHGGSYVEELICSRNMLKDSFAELAHNTQGQAIAVEEGDGDIA